MEGMKIYKRPKLKDPYLVVAWPGMGEVAFKAASFLVEQLKAEQFATIFPEDFFYLASSVVHEGILNVPALPQSNFYYWKNKSGENDLIIFISNAQPDLGLAEIYAEKILHLAKLFKVDTIVSFASMPQPIDHTMPPGVWFAATTPELKNDMVKYNFNLLAQGQISGMNGLFLGLAKRQGFKGICLLGEIPFYTIQIENPKASKAVLEALAKVLHIEIDCAPLLEQSQLMGEEINKLLDFLKVGPQGGIAPIGEEEIEKIKKTLSQLTKLPTSVKAKVEKLFEEAKSDKDKARELKAELDIWNVYKDYEDRFLDLFKKKKGKDN